MHLYSNPTLSFPRCYPKQTTFFQALCISSSYMSCVMRDSIFSLGENKGADQLSAISGFVSTTGIVQFLFFLNPKLQASKLNHDTIRKHNHEDFS